MGKYFWTSILPKVIDIRTTSISSGVAARASRIASISSTPWMYELNRHTMFNGLGVIYRVCINYDAVGRHDVDKEA